MTPSFDFIICINLSKRVHRESFHGMFCARAHAHAHTRAHTRTHTWQRPPPHRLPLCGLLLRYPVRAHRLQNKSVERPRHGYLAKASNSTIKSGATEQGPTCLLLSWQKTKNLTAKIARAWFRTRDLPRDNLVL